MPISTAQSKVYQKLGISCLIPKLLRPLQPIVERLSCKLGLDLEEDSGYMKSGLSCNEKTCRDPSIESRLITRDLGVPNMDDMIQGQISTYDDCFPEMEKATYGSRVLAKLVDDVSCEDPRYQGICQEQSLKNRELLEENCLSTG